MILARPTRSLIRYIQMVTECSAQRRGRHAPCYWIIRAAPYASAIRVTIRRSSLTTEKPKATGKERERTGVSAEALPEVPFREAAKGACLPFMRFRAGTPKQR